MTKKEVLSFLRKAKRSHLNELLKADSDGKNVQFTATKVGTVRVFTFIVEYDEYAFTEVWQGTKRISSVSVQSVIKDWQGASQFEIYVPGNEK